MPSIEKLAEMMELLKEVLFPGFFGVSQLNEVTLHYEIGAKVGQIFHVLSEQIKRGVCFACDQQEDKCLPCHSHSEKLAYQFLDRLPHIKQLLATDVVAAFEGDPAAKNYGETIFSYPSIAALTHHRIAHEMIQLDIPLIPRIIAEMSHSKTGIDIHPGATIGESFFIDHGTGVVIGETAVIGKNVRLYQGVTLGAKSFPLDEQGNPIKGIPRHPILEDNVTIYANSTILGRITLGNGAVIGGNMWITQDVGPGEKHFKKNSTL